MIEIPDDVMKVARDAAAEGSWNGVASSPWVVVIARAILAERERCAKVAEAQTIYVLPSHRRLVAAAIRKGSAS